MIESTFNRHFQSEFSRPIYHRDDFDSKSRSEFEVRFELYPKLVKFDQKFVEFDRKRHFWFQKRRV